MNEMMDAVVFTETGKFEVVTRKIPIFYIIRRGLKQIRVLFWDMNVLAKWWKREPVSRLLKRETGLFLITICLAAFVRLARAAAVISV